MVELEHRASGRNSLSAPPPTESPPVLNAQLTCYPPWKSRGRLFMPFSQHSNTPRFRLLWVDLQPQKDAEVLVPRACECDRIQEEDPADDRVKM